MKQNKNKEILSGIALGILVGSIIGLSVSHVVGIVLGALTSLLASFFGLTAVKDDDQNRVKFSTKPLTIIYFSFSTVVFILVGMYMRTHNVLTPSVKDQKAELIDIGVPQGEINKILLKIRYDITMDNQGNLSRGESTLQQTATSLYSVQLKKADSIFALPSYSYAQLADLYKSEQGDMTKFYNTINLYIKDTLLQKDILKSALELIKKGK